MPSANLPQIRTTIEPLDETGHVARVTVDNPTRLNVLGARLIDELTAAIRALEPDRQLRCVVLKGAGDRAFIGGADIREMVGLDSATAHAFITRLHLACAAIRELPVPVVARIHGYCLGAGLEIAASCDLRVASDDATFGMPEVNVGIPSVIEAALLSFEVSDSVQNYDAGDAGASINNCLMSFRSNLITIGSRRPIPNAFPLTRKPGGAWRRLYSLRSTS